jgi:2-dehydropantoate 2-reductase
MKILVLGAGAIGGYFGARLQQAGADVTYLVRSRRAQQLAAHGLAVRSPFGDFEVTPRWVQAHEVREPYDLVLLTCKAYDLDGALEAIAPAMGPSSHVLPLLNGLLHLDRLAQAFGPQRVVGGACSIPVTLGPQGEVLHLAKMHRIAFGALPGTSPDARARLEALHAFLSKTPVDTVLADDMMLEMWEKFVGLATLAAMTCLMRATVGDIVSSEEGGALMTEALEACVRTATAAGYAPREAPMAGFRRMLLDPASTGAASMLRDLEGGHRTEGRHVVADMLRRAREAGVDPGPLRAAWCHLESHELRARRESAKG